ncbi:MAG: hypothetical protein LBO07_05180 [Coriobacteriales bacterium]|nr:hypothetical protein [Coriobacteriales bacterium]
MAKCWEQRGCDAEMLARCPHATSSADGLCVAECFYAQCRRPTREVATDYELLFDPDVDRQVAVKEICRSCVFFLRHAPRLLR